MNTDRKIPIGGAIVIPGLPPIQFPDGKFPFPIQPPQSGSNNQFMKLKSVIENAYVTIGSNNRLYASEKNSNNGQVFRMVPQNNNRVKLRIRGGNFVRFDSNGLLIADTNERGGSLFTVSQTSALEYVLLASNGKYVRVRNNDKVLIAAADNSGPRTKFNFEKINNNEESGDNNQNNDEFMNLKSVVENAYVTVGQNNSLYATQADSSKSTIFRLILKDNGNTGKLRIKGGNFIRLGNNGLLTADTNNQGATTFTVYQTAPQEYVFMAPNGKYVRVRNNDKVLIAAADSSVPRTKFKFRSI